MNFIFLNSNKSPHIIQNDHWKYSKKNYHTLPTYKKQPGSIYMYIYVCIKLFFIVSTKIRNMFDYPPQLDSQ